MGLMLVNLHRVHRVVRRRVGLRLGRLLGFRGGQRQRRPAAAPGDPGAAAAVLTGPGERGERRENREGWEE